MENTLYINWYPGHMAKTKRQIEADLKMIDIVIELLDARIPISSQNPDIAQLTKNKKKIVVLNKCDLSDEKRNQYWINYFKKQGTPAVLTDSNTGKEINDLYIYVDSHFNTNEEYNIQMFLQRNNSDYNLNETTNKKGQSRKKNKSNDIGNSKCGEIFIYK